MKQILIISGSVWRRLLRLKSLYFLTACGIALMAISCSYKYLMGFEQKMLMTDVALVVTNLATILCVLALAFDIPRELKSGTATMLLSKPLGRNQFLLGKLLGIDVARVC